MKKILLFLMCIFLVFAALGCADVADAPLESPPDTTVAKEETPVESHPDPTTTKEETPTELPFETEWTSWDEVSVIPEDLGMENTLDNPAFSEVFNNTSKAPLNKLIAFCLIADGLSEGANDELYWRFMEAPDTVLVFLSLLGNQTYPLTGMGEVSIAEFICKNIALADAVWYGSTAEFKDIITECRNDYPTGRINELLDILEREHNSAIEANASNG